jgi:hypothetical protein
MAEKQEKREQMAADHPKAIEFRVPSCKYNCHGFAYTNSHGFFAQPQLFLADDFTQISMANAQPGDVLIYEDGVAITHSALVRKVTGGKITSVRSKWGRMAAFTHDPVDVPVEYGQATRLFRRNV